MGRAIDHDSGSLRVTANSACEPPFYRSCYGMIYALEADITTLTVDCIVSAANNTMLGGGGVDGAIHRAAGPKLLACCREFPVGPSGHRLPTGHARITPAFDLPCKFVIHTAGPVWRGGGAGEVYDLADCYRNSVRLAAMHGRSVAIPAISTGIYGFPFELACRTALAEARLADRSDLTIILVAWRSPEVSAWYQALGVPYRATYTCS